MSEEVKRGPGRPTKAEVDAKHPKHKMKAKPNWDDMIPAEEADTADRLHIPREMIPEGMDLQWVTDSVYGKEMSQHRSGFEKRGWTPVHQSDFDGVFDGMFLPKGVDGEIKVDGLVLMARPLEISLQAKKLDKRRAREQVEIKEAAWKAGDLPNVTLDSRNRAATSKNVINKSLERLEIPQD